MGAPKNPRKKAPEKKLENPNMARKGSQNYFSKLMSTPEGRALRKQWSNKPKKNAGRPRGTLTVTLQK